MTPYQRLKRRITKFEFIQSGILLFMPLVLVFLSGEMRPSISNYTYSEVSDWFCVLLAIAGTMFVRNGVDNNRHWYNIILGCCLIGVALTPHLDIPYWHYFFAGTFFIGSCFVMVFFSSPKQRMYKFLASIFIIIGMVGYFGLNWYSLFYAEWIGMLPISIHFVLESLEKID